MERRSSMRLPIAVQALIYKADASEPRHGELLAGELPVALGRIVDLSRGGVLLETTAGGMGTGRRVELDLLLRNSGIDTHAHCRMVVRRKTARGYALSVDPECAFSRTIMSRLHRRYIGRVACDPAADAARAMAG